MTESESRRRMSPWVLVLAGVALMGVGVLRFFTDTARSPWVSLVGGAVAVVVGLVLALRRSRSGAAGS